MSELVTCHGARSIYVVFAKSLMDCGLCEFICNLEMEKVLEYSKTRHDASYDCGESVCDE